MLVGFMGTGKTTVGKIIAQHLCRPMVDTDQYLEEKRGKSIADIFSTEGEPSFRQQEHDTLTELIQTPEPLVITTGGGIVLRSDNVELMMRYGWVAALTAARDVLIQRLQQDSSRPLLMGDLEKRIDDLLVERSKAYDFAHFKVDTSNKTPAEVAQCILGKYEKSR